MTPDETANDTVLLGKEYPLIDSSNNARFFALTERLVAIVPFVDAHDDDESSRQSIAIQESYFREGNVKGGTVIFMDRVLEQDRKARLNYKTLPDPNLICGFALITESVLGRAMSSLFLGLSATRVPSRVFPNFEQAKKWLLSRMDP